MASDGRNINNVPGKDSFNLASLKRDMQYVLITNASYQKAYDKGLKQAASEGKLDQGVVELISNDVEPEESGYSNEAFFEKIIAFAERHAHEITLADEELIIMVGSAKVKKLLEAECGDDFTYSLCGNETLKQIIRDAEEPMDMRVVSSSDLEGYSPGCNDEFARDIEKLDANYWHDHRTGRIPNVHDIDTDVFVDPLMNYLFAYLDDECSQEIVDGIRGIVKKYGEEIVTFKGEGNNIEYIVLSLDDATDAHELRDELGEALDVGISFDEKDGLELENLCLQERGQQNNPGTGMDHE